MVSDRNDRVFVFPYLRQGPRAYEGDNFDFEGNPRNNSRFGHLVPVPLPRGDDIADITKIALYYRTMDDPRPPGRGGGTTEEHLEAGRIQRAWRRHRTRRHTRLQAARHAIRGRPLTGKKR